MGSGPLAGVTVVELEGIGPAPFCGMMLADMGADVVRLARPSPEPVDDARWRNAGRHQYVDRGRRSVALDLKAPAGRGVALRLIERADALVEGFRPGVMERLGLGPEVCLGRNPRLVYGRVTGWGREGPLAGAPGHDLNFIALAGALHASVRHGMPPVAPPTVIGDMGGGGLLLAFGIACALFEARASGRGQVVDAAVVDGAALLSTLLYAFCHAGLIGARGGGGFIDGGAHFYDVYECADGRHVSIGALERRFYARLLERLGVTDLDPDAQFDPATWPRAKARLAALFRSRSREEWCRLLEGSDCCFAPVLDLDEAPRHPHNAARGSFVEVDGALQPAPAPRLDRTPGAVQGPPPKPGEQGEAVLADFGFSAAEIQALRGAGVLHLPGDAA